MNLNHKANWLRNRILDLVYTSKHGHIGGAFSCVEILVALYYGDILKDTDKFILSKGHSCVALYPILADKGSNFCLRSFCQNGSMIGGHPHKGIKGVEMDSGALGHGLGVGAGMALAGNKVYVLVGDGELEEGSNWEALMFIAHHKLDVTVIVDYNGYSVLDSTDCLYPLGDKLKAFGMNVVVTNGHDIDSLVKDMRGKTPMAVVAWTKKGKGVSYMENEIRWHHSIPTQEEYERAKGELK